MIADISLHDVQDHMDYSRLQTQCMNTMKKKTTPKKCASPIIPSSKSIALTLIYGTLVNYKEGFYTEKQLEEIFKMIINDCIPKIETVKLLGTMHSIISQIIRYTGHICTMSEQQKSNILTAAAKDSHAVMDYQEIRKIVFADKDQLTKAGKAFFLQLYEESNTNLSAKISLSLLLLICLIENESNLSYFNVIHDTIEKGTVREHAIKKQATTPPRQLKTTPERSYEEEEDLLLKDIYQFLQAIPPQPGEAYDMLLSPALSLSDDKLTVCGQKVKDSSQRLNGIYPSLENLTPYEAPLQDIPNKAAQYKATKETHITTTEAYEAALYHHVTNRLHELIPGDANCQSAVNSVEYFARGLGYNQIIAVKNPLESNVSGDASAPVACWNIGKTSIDNSTSFISDDNAFREAINKGQSSTANDSYDTIQCLNGKRYILLTTDKSGAIEHFMNMIRFESTDRFWILDRQFLPYPILNPDGTFTNEAISALKDRNIHVLRTDKIPNDIFVHDLTEMQELIEKTNKVAPIVNVLINNYLRLPDEAWESIREGAKHLSILSKERCTEAEIYKALTKCTTDDKWRKIPQNFHNTLQQQLDTFKRDLKNRNDSLNDLRIEILDVLPSLSPSCYTFEGFYEAVSFISAKLKLYKDLVTHILYHSFNGELGWKQFWFSIDYVAIEPLISALQNPHLY